MIGAWDLIFLPLLSTAAVFCLLGTLLTVLHRMRPRSRPDTASPVTVLKPLDGIFPGLRDALESFFLQDHPHYQIVIGVRSGDEPARGIAEELRRSHPGVDCQVVTAGPNLGTNPKVTNLQYMMEAAKHDLVLISDDDVRADRDYLTRMAGSFRDPQVGVVTSPSWARPKGPLLALDALTRATEFLPLVLFLERLDEGLSFALGASSMFRRKTLEDIGGLGNCSDCLAEDYILGSRGHNRGWQIQLAPEAVELRHEFGSAGDYLEYQIRWSRTYRVCRPRNHLLSILTQGIFLGLIFIAVTGASRMSLAATAGFAALRLLTSAADILLLCRPSLLLWLPLLPLRDLLSTVFWTASFLGRTVRWRGRKFRLLPDGRLTLMD